jgi:Flp pilus assembly pilin Flp
MEYALERCFALLFKLFTTSLISEPGGDSSVPAWTACRGIYMKSFVFSLWTGNEGQDIAEYAVMLAVILVIVIGTIRMIGSNASTVFSSVASAVH